MKSISLQQGSQAWHEHRRTKFNASDAPAMLGESPHCSRSELLHRMATGIAPEVDDATQRRFDAGHRVEALLRKVAEQIVGEPLHPFVGIADFDERYSASFDGCTFVGDETSECKLLNARLRAAFADMETIAPEHREREAGNCLPLDYRIQMEQQIRIAGAERSLFLAGELRDDDTLGDVFSCWYYPDDALWARIRSGWEQFAADLAAYVPPAAAEPAPTGRAPDSLPALRIEVTGMVTASNLDAFKAHALAVFGGINRDLKTDSDFADAEKTVKWCSDVEQRLAAAKQHALSQTASIDELFRTVDEISAEARRVRLDLDKLVKARKESIRGEIVAGGVAALRSHILALNTRLGGAFMPAIPADFGAAVKGLRTVSSVQDAVDTELARAKIAASEAADRVEANLKLIDAQPMHLFRDVATLVHKATDDLQAIIAARLGEEQRRQEAERERIRAEEQAKAEKAARDRIEAEQREALAREVAEARKTAGPEKPTIPLTSTPVASPAVSSQAPNVVPMGTRAPDTAARIKLGEINARLAPIALTADGLAALGFQPVATEKAAKLYAAGDFPRICSALVAHVSKVSGQQRAA